MKITSLSRVLSLLAVAVVGVAGSMVPLAPASAAGKYYTAVGSTVYTDGTAFTPASVSITNITRSQTIGSVEVDIPAVEGFTLEWSITGCQITRAGSATANPCSPSWQITPGLSSRPPVFVETPNNTGAALGNNDSLTLQVSVLSCQVSLKDCSPTDFSASGLSVPVTITAKQSNTFNDGKLANLFDRSGSSAAILLRAVPDMSNVTICPSDPTSTTCTLTPTSGPFSQITTTVDYASTVFLGVLGDRLQCGLVGSDPVPAVTVFVYSDAAKVVKVVWSKSYVNGSPDNGAGGRWPVCLDYSPNTFWAVDSARGTILKKQVSEGELATCAQLSSAGLSGPCLVKTPDKSAGGGQVTAYVSLPGGAQDPRIG